MHPFAGSATLELLERAQQHSPEWRNGLLSVREGEVPIGVAPDIVRRLYALRGQLRLELRHLPENTPEQIKLRYNKQLEVVFFLLQLELMTHFKEEVRTPILRAHRQVVRRPETEG